jgi:uncharacterized membrane protein
MRSRGSPFAAGGAEDRRARGAAEDRLVWDNAIFPVECDKIISCPYFTVFARIYAGLDAAPARGYALPMDAKPPIFLDAELRPNRSLSPAGFRIVMGAMAAMSLIPGLIFLSQGAWPVFGFLGLDVLAVYLAFRYSYAQGRAREYVRVTTQDLDIQRLDQRGRQTSAERFPSYWARVAMDDPPEPDSRLTISASGRATTVGDFLSAEERLSLANALREALARARQG